MARIIAIALAAAIATAAAFGVRNLFHGGCPSPSCAASTTSTRRVAFDVFNDAVIWKSPLLGTGKAIDVVQIGFGPPEIIVAAANRIYVYSNDAGNGVLCGLLAEVQWLGLDLVTVVQYSREFTARTLEIVDSGVRKNLLLGIAGESPRIIEIDARSGETSTNHRRCSLRSAAMASMNFRTPSMEVNDGRLPRKAESTLHDRRSIEDDV